MKRALGCVFLLSVSSALLAQSPTGTWALNPPQTTIYQASVQQPINPDGTSVWPSNKGVVPVQFSLALGYGPVVFESLQNGSPAYSNLTFTPASPLTFADITNLSAAYAFTTGTCHGGGFRWSIVFMDGSAIFVYYGKDSTFWSDCSSVSTDPTIDQSAANMINADFDGSSAGDARYERSDRAGTYTTYSDVSAFAAGKTIQYIALVVDGGWGGDEVITLGNVTINSNTFVPQTGSAPTCDLPPATMQLTRTAGTVTGVVDETAIQANADYGSSYRITGCNYVYNLSAKPLGPGTYKVQVLINNTPTGGSGQFALK